MKLEVLQAILSFFTGEELRGENSLFSIVETEMSDIRLKLQFFKTELQKSKTLIQFQNTFLHKYGIKSRIQEILEQEFPLLKQSMKENKVFYQNWL